MSKRPAPKAPAKIRGTTLIEVLVTVVIIALGLLGMAGLQSRSHALEFESYQRGQALILLQDMVDRMNNNATAAAGYVTGATPMGTGATDAADCTALASRALADLCEWSKALKGSAELSGSTKQGAAIDGRGCIVSTGTNAYLVSVAWQGMSATFAPVNTCGQNSYSSETTRRVVGAVVVVPDLGAN
ncbi:MAG: type IV pilus modification protein PilV [Rhodocyclales bacterium GWA2_65_20]|nr:MAG: type IV pilus modification protein PilV [Rhodocyclales bacterium GWA2_65_20]